MQGHAGWGDQVERSVLIDALLLSLQWYVWPHNCSTVAKFPCYFLSLLQLYLVWLVQYHALAGPHPGHSALMEVQQHLLQSPRPEIDEDYWPAITKLILIGQLGPAVEVITLHPAFKAAGEPAAQAQARVGVTAGV